MQEVVQVDDAVSVEGKAGSVTVGAYFVAEVGKQEEHVHDVCRPHTPNTHE